MWFYFDLVALFVMILPAVGSLFDGCPSFAMASEPACFRLIPFPRSVSCPCYII